ncbi:transcriptional repressor [soil metagenome]
MELLFCYNLTMATATPSTLAAFRPHDHRQCRREGRAAVEAECAARGLRLTPARACVLDVLLEAHRAVTAYELLDRLREAGLGKQPPIVYHALNFLVTNAFAHRIERLAAYVACTAGAGQHQAAFLVCRACRTVAETAILGPEHALAEQSAPFGFAVERVSVEAEGLCARCRAAPA